MDREIEMGIRERAFLHRLLKELFAEYRPYDTLPEFQEGFEAYQAGQYGSRHEGVAGQAFDRGLEAGMRWNRLLAVSGASLVR